VQLGFACARPRFTIEVRPIDVCHPTLCNEYPYSAAPGSSSGLAPSVYLRGWHLSGPRNRAFHDARIALEDRGSLEWEYSSHSQAPSSTYL